MKSLQEEYGISPAVGVILLLGITAALATIAGVVLLDIGDGLTQNAQAGVEVNETTEGVEVTWTTDNNADEIIVQANGQRYTLNSVNDSITLGLNEGSNVSVIGVIDGEESVISETTTESGTGNNTVENYNPGSTETLSGTVSVNPPIDGATVRVVKNDTVVATTTTDSSGNYSVESPENSRLEVVVKDFTYDSGSKTFYGSTVRDVGSDLSSPVNVDFTEPESTVNIEGNSVLVRNGSYDGMKTIGSVEQLQGITNDFSGDYILLNDIDASETSSWNSGSGFVLQDGNNDFSGTLDGNGYKIEGLDIDANSLDYIGLFRLIGNDGLIKNLTITGEVTGNNSTGVLAGELEGDVQNVTIDATVIGNNKVGGLSGENIVNNISNVTVSGSVEGESEVGGLTGYSSYSQVKNVTVDSSILGNQDFTGGIVGDKSSGDISSATVSGAVEGQNFVGGIAGDSDTVLSSSSVKGTVSGSSTVGGIVGLNTGTVEKSYVTASIESSDSIVGGLIGQNGEDAKSFRDGNDGVLRDSYWDTEATGLTSSIGQQGGDDDTSNGTVGGSSIVEGEVSGLTTSEMQGDNASSTMSAFDFTNTWTTTNEYPVQK